MDKFWNANASGNCNAVAGASDIAPAYQLRAVLPEWCVLKWHHAASSFLYVAFFLLCCYTPVSSPQTWECVLAGELAIAGNDFSGAVPLTAGMRQPASSWLSDSLAALIYAGGGASALSIAYAIWHLLTLCIWHLLLRRLTSHWLSALGGVLLIAVVNLAWLSGWQPLLCGQLFFAALLLACSGARDSLWVRSASKDGASNSSARSGWLDYLLIGGICAIWSNFDASVVVGVGFLLIAALATLVDAWRASSFAAALRSDQVRSATLRFEVGLLAACLVPYESAWWRAAMWWPKNGLSEPLGWSAPATFDSLAGLSVLCGWLMWTFVTRRCKRLPSLWVLAPLVATLSLATSAMALIWFVPLILIATAILAQHHQENAPRTQLPNTKRGRAATRSDIADSLLALESMSVHPTGGLRFLYTLVAGLLVWLGFCFSPLGAVLGGHARTDAEALGRHVPIAAQRWLADDASRPTVLAPAYWGDYLAATTDTKVMVTHRLTRVPNIVANDYGQIASGAADWKTLSDKYAIDYLLIDKARQTRLTRKVRRSQQDWKIEYEDRATAVARRL